MKIWALLIILYASGANAEMKIGPSIDLLSTPHPLSLKLHFKHRKFNFYFTSGAYRSLENDNQSIVMRNQGIGLQYHFKNLYTSLEYGQQTQEVYLGSGQMTGNYVKPALGYHFEVKDSGLFFQSEIGYQFNHQIESKGDAIEVQALKRFGQDNLMNFTLIRIGYFF